MDFLWLTSSPGNTAAVSALSGNAILLDASNDPAQLIRDRQAHRGDRDGCECAAIIIDIEDLAGAERAFDLIDALQTSAGDPGGASAPLWIFYPEASVAATVSFLKAGASLVATRIEEIEDALAAAALTPPGSSLAGSGPGSLIGASRATRAVAANVGLVANRRCNVLIEGETGTGKEVVARQIHASGNRTRGPWVAVNCGAIPEALLEAELFGHVRGAFTGAVQARQGKFEAANHGTIFLDEVGEMPLSVQAKLLRILQEREVERLGGNERIPLDVRVIAATNANLAQRVSEGLFRADLYYRLNVFRIALTPLRERPVDIPALAQHFAARISASENLRPKTLDPSALEQLCAHDWPGNARELENVMETAIILSGSRTAIYASDIRFSRAAVAVNSPSWTARIALPPEGLDYQETLHSFEHDLLTQAISRTRGNKTAAADLLRLKRTTLSARMRVLESRLPRLVA